MQELAKKRMKELETKELKLKGPYSIKIADTETGTWRDIRPVVDTSKCIGCSICANHCPCGVIDINEKIAEINYRYCKGCGICSSECPVKAIDMVDEERGELNG